ncbi:RDD family protein [Phycicoccus sonneratiae]|uniref:RDD family protein n=1 Tax=Phycicoccus sonneratiae TaxID=2807628 RepID=A0ABS2CJX8_9MICO|nr:RDD family protein [Phycicoccus sonneraticus]MBM6400188.1 RDD family protein [Phycicoccus sonneraticus]
MPPTPTRPDAPTAGDASLLRRLAGFVVDWVLSALVTFLLLPYDLAAPGEQPPLLLGVPESSWAVLGVFFLLNAVLVSLTGSTVGHRLLGLQVWQVRPGPFPLQVLVRSALAALVLPAAVTVRGRGLHDLAAGTRIVRPGAADAPGAAGS